MNVQEFSVISAYVGTRAAVSYAAGYFTPAGLVYNAVDVIVSYVALQILGDDGGCSLLVAPVIGCLAGFAVTWLCFGAMSVMVAVALMATSFVAFALTVVACEGNTQECCDFD